MAKYIPKVIVCGYIDAFRKIIGDKSVTVVKQIEISEVDEQIKLLIEGAAEFLIFTEATDFFYCREKFPYNVNVMTAETFAQIYSKDFAVNKLSVVLKLLFRAEKFSGRVLDFDCYFAKADFRANDDFAIDCFAENFGGEFFPIHENLYDKIYRNADEWRYKFFDKIIFTAERTPEEFVNVLIATENSCEKICVFARKNSALEGWLNDSQYIFAEVKIYPIVNGAWYFITKRIPLVDVGVYVVTHKNAKLSALPEGYRIIHAGHALAKNDFGYLGDDTGDNISRLNIFLDEVTALYWLWKNTSHTHAGFVHYRRFLTKKFQPEFADNRQLFLAEDILSSQEICQILNEYDIIASKAFSSNFRQYELFLLSTGQPDLVRICEGIFRANLKRKQPDYLAAYDSVINSQIFFPYGILITRRNILNDYCEWLFSFLIDAVKEINDRIQIGDKKLEDMGHKYSRMPSFLAERMLTVWLMKNHLRIKTLPIMYRNDV